MGVYIGLDIGGTKCAAVAGALEGENLRILAREAFATPHSQEEAMDRLCALAEGLAQGRQILGVGISSGGPMDAERGMLCNAPARPGAPRKRRQRLRAGRVALWRGPGQPSSALPDVRHGPWRGHCLGGAHPARRKRQRRGARPLAHGGLRPRRIRQDRVL